MRDYVPDIMPIVCSSLLFVVLIYVIDWVCKLIDKIKRR